MPDTLNPTDSYRLAVNGARAGLYEGTTLAATHYSPSAVHTLLEVSMRGDDGRAAGHVAGTGKIKRQPDGSRLLAAGELEERPCAEDARAKSLALTAKGTIRWRKLTPGVPVRWWRR
ncbi:hypothetical protein LNP20_07585 [Klebsiella pneumoniae subsp. pneumoniae]|nr:hypothetical protein [Klebsiella pneumoniae subsp. pneumoniae]